MADLRKTAQSVLEEAREGIAWIALYRQGRGWAAECFRPNLDREGDGFTFEDVDAAELKDILRTDSNAIFVNGYYTNLGDTEEMTRESLTAFLRWQYENQYSRLADAI